VLGSGTAGGSTSSGRLFVLAKQGQLFTDSEGRLVLAGPQGVLTVQDRLSSLA
jgi:hypothetical protein